MSFPCGTVRRSLMSAIHGRRQPAGCRWTGLLRAERVLAIPGGIAAVVLFALFTTACGAGDDQTDSAPSSPAVAAVSDQAQTSGPQPGQVKESLPPAGTVNLPFSVALSFMDTPGLGQQVPLQISMYSTVGPSMVMVEVDELPAGVSLVQGGRHWEACLEEEESKAFELLLAFRRRAPSASARWWSQSWPAALATSSSTSWTSR